MKPTLTTRRQFLVSSAAAALSVSIIPRHVLGAGQTPPSRKLRIGCVGIGG